MLVLYCLRGRDLQSKTRDLREIDPCYQPIKFEHSPCLQSKHIDYITSKANQALALLQRNLISCPTQVKINCYKTFFHPIMDYCSTVWSPYTLCNINKAEAIQRRAARFVLNDYSRYSSVTAMLDRLSWNTLEKCRSSLKHLLRL